MEFEWDSAKAALNLRKHGIVFEEASQVFLDPGRIEFHDGREAYGEDRWVTIGFSGTVLLSVVYAVRGVGEERIRLISARKANANERANYGSIQN